MSKDNATKIDNLKGRDFLKHFSKESNKNKESTESSISKRKHDTDESNTESALKTKRDDENDTKKLKMPIKLGGNSNGASLEKKSTSEQQQVEISKPPQPPLEPKLPTGNLASSKKLPINVVKNVSEKVAKVFGSDSDDEVEEMPFEAKMKMRNLGRNTPTSQGPNSYGKSGNLGFVDRTKLFEKQLKEKSEELLRQEAEALGKK